MATTPLIFACKKVKNEKILKKVVKFLVESGADVNSSDNDESTPLILACSHDHKEIAQFLIKSGADVNVSNNVGYTALMCTRDKEIRKLIIDAGHKK